MQRVVHQLPRPKSGTTDTPSDKMAVIAQRYAGYFTGIDYRFDQQANYEIVTPEGSGIHLGKKWKEPNVVRDDCEFCQRLTDESAIARVAGYQHQIDIEVIRGKNILYYNWLGTNNPPGIVDWEDDQHDANEPPRQFGVMTSAANRRAFVELHQDTARDGKPDGWQNKSLPMIDLPLKLKRKLCIEWNHVYTDYLREHPDVTYNFDTKLFYRDLPDLPLLECCGGKELYDVHENKRKVHLNTCPEPLSEGDFVFHPWLGV